MRNLLKADFYRILKNKLAFISLIIAAVFPIVLCATFLGLKELFSFGDEETKEMLGLAFNSHLVVSTTFSFTNNFGIAMPIFAAIIVLSDISSGTIRNKIILGYNRHKIFVSHFITCMVYCLVLMLVYASMTALWSVIFLGAENITQEHAMSLLYFYILGMLLYAVVSIIVTSLALLTFSTAGSIILTVAICMGIGLITSLLMMFDYSKFEHIFNFIPAFVMGLFQIDEIGLIPFLESLAGTVVFGVAFYALGAFGFSKKDLK